MGRAKSISNEDIERGLMESGEVPKHIAIIMDGNGRWAKSKGLPRIAGHRVGVESVRNIVKACSRLGVHYLTLYTFSIENWKRPKTEVTTLMRLLVRTIRKEIQELNENDVRLITIGDTASLPEAVQKELQDAKVQTAKNKKLVLNLALSYSGRWDIIEAAKSLAREIAEGRLSYEEITPPLFSKHLSTSDIPDPDLLIRTSKEIRISNFLLWQIAYTEIFFSDVLWPDFREKNLYDAITDFQQRERRFGKVSEQLQKHDKRSNDTE